MNSPNQNVIDKLVVARKIIGFANIGVFPSENRISVTKQFVSELKLDLNIPNGLLETDKALSALSSSFIPSPDLCLKSLKEVDAYLIPMRQARRDAILNLEIVSSTPRMTQ